MPVFVNQTIDQTAKFIISNSIYACINNNQLRYAPNLAYSEGPTPAYKTASPVRVIQLLNHHCFAWRRGMNKFMITYIYAYMRDFIPIQPKKD